MYEIEYDGETVGVEICEDNDQEVYVYLSQYWKYKGGMMLRDAMLSSHSHSWLGVHRFVVSTKGKELLQEQILLGDEKETPSFKESTYIPEIGITREPENEDGDV